MAQLPLAVKRDVRDQFESPEGDLQSKLKILKEAIGYPVNCNIDWPLVWTQCEAHLEDKSIFVPCVISHVSTLCDALVTKLENEAAPWTEQFLEHIEPIQALRIDIEVSPSSKKSRDTRQTQPQNTSVRLSKSHGLVLDIPFIASSYSSTSQLLRDLDSIFIPNPHQSNAEDDDWASITTPSSQQILTPASSFSFPSHTAAIVPPKSTSFPSLATLSRPDVLFAHSVPYIIQLRYERNRSLVTSGQRIPDRIIIQSTHEPSLKLIHDYFIKWTRSDPQTREKIPLMRFSLGPSTFGPGLYHDTLVIEPFSQVSGRSGSSINPPLLQCFIESVLGYDVVGRGTSGGEEGEFWEFRRMTAFD